VARAAPQAAVDDPSAIDLALLESLSNMQDAAAARSAVRYSTILNSLGMGKLQKQLADRSAIFMTLFTEAPEGQAQGAREGVVGDAALFYTGMVFMFIGILSTVLWVPTFLACAVYGGLYPVIQLGLHLGGPNAQELLGHSHLLQHALSLVYILLILLLGCMVPFVYRFQLFRTDLVDLKNFPGVFYDVRVVRELHRRFIADVEKQRFERFLDNRFGDDIMKYIKGYIENYDEIFM
jgi:hypothetical protein